MNLYMLHKNIAIAKLHGADDRKVKRLFNGTKHKRLPARVKAPVIKEKLIGRQSTTYAGPNMYLCKVYNNIILSLSVTGK